jgi:hypothetical protein
MSDSPKVAFSNVIGCANCHSGDRYNYAQACRNPDVIAYLDNLPGFYSKHVMIDGTDHVFIYDGLVCNFHRNAEKLSNKDDFESNNRAVLDLEIKKEVARFRKFFNDLHSRNK